MFVTVVSGTDRIQCDGIYWVTHDLFYSAEIYINLLGKISPMGECPDSWPSARTGKHCTQSQCIQVYV